MKTFLISLIMVLTCSSATFAYGVYTDAARAAAIIESTNKSKAVMEEQLGRQGMITASHVITIQQISDVNMFQKEFNEYVDSVRNLITIAAQLYGLYYEADQCFHLMGKISKLATDNPQNALAVTISLNRNYIYRDIIDRSTDVINDIYVVCFSKAKMTVAERWKIMGSIRPKLRLMNKDLRRLCLFLRYTTLGDVWREIMGGAERYKVHSRAEIATNCMDSWKYKFRTY